MYERFTELARKVMKLARLQAQRYDRDCICTEHILLGLLDENAGVAVNVFEYLRVDLRMIRSEVERLLQAGTESVYLVQSTDLVNKVIECATDEARSLGSNYVSTEHLLLGILRVNEGVAALALRNLRIRYEYIREMVVNLLDLMGPLPGMKSRKEIEAIYRHPLVASIHFAIDTLESLIISCKQWQKYELAAEVRDLIKKMRKVSEEYH